MRVTIESNILTASREVGEVFRSQIPFAVSAAMNDTMFQAREHIVNVTYLGAFTVRNKVLPRVLFRVLKKASKRDLVTILGQNPAIAKVNWLELHVTGGIKKSHDGGDVAIPTQGITRTSSGAVPVAKRPRRVRDRKNAFVAGKKGSSKRKIMERNAQGDLFFWYRLVSQARIKPRFDFYGDVEKVIQRNFLDHFEKRLARSV